MSLKQTVAAGQQLEAVPLLKDMKWCLDKRLDGRSGIVEEVRSLTRDA